MNDNTRYLLCGVAGAVLVVATVIGLLHYGIVVLGCVAVAVMIGVPVGLWVRRNT